MQTICKENQGGQQRRHDYWLWKIHLKAGEAAYI